MTTSPGAFVHIATSPPRLLAGQADAALGMTDDAWVKWTWDGQQLEASSDPLGFLPVFYWLGPGEAMLATSLVTLIELGAPTDLDHQALGVFVRLGHFLGDQTPFSAIKVLPPGASMRVSPTESTVSESRLNTPAEIHESRPALRDGYQERFAEAMRRRAAGDRVLMPISAGRDSRHILAELVGQKAPIESLFTVARQRSDPDVVAGRRLAAAVGIDHQVFPASRITLETELRKNHRTHFCADEHTWFMPLADHLSARGGVVYDGIGGDVLSESKNLTERRMRLVESGRFEDLALDLFPYRAEESLKAVATPEFYARVPLEAAVFAIAEELRRHASAPNPIGSYQFWNRTRREVALMPFGLLSDSRLRVETPYLDHELVTFLQSIPASQLVDRRFHTETIAQVAPHLARVPYGEDIPASKTRHKRLWAINGRLQAERVVASVRRESTVGDMLELPWGRILVDARIHFDWYAVFPAYLHCLGELVSRSPRG